MTNRDELAEKIMLLMISDADIRDCIYHEFHTLEKADTFISNRAYRLADAFIKAGEKK